MAPANDSGSDIESIASGDELYPAIGDHGMIGDLQTAALVAVDGTIDFLCLPQFDSPTVFLRLLDAERGGYFAIAPVASDPRRAQRYLRDTNVLVTRFTSSTGEIEVVDFMAIERAQGPSRLVRLVRCARGQVRVRARCAPRLEYARVTPMVVVTSQVATFTDRGSRGLCLTSSVPLTVTRGVVEAEFDVAVGQSVSFVLEDVTRRPPGGAMRDARWARRALRRTIVFWRRWIGHSPHRGEWHNIVRRSALALKLMQSRRTGAIIASPTFGLPEQIGGARNWDFRYAWIRDSSFTVYALLRMGLCGEAKGFTRWIVRRCEEAREPGALQSFYGIDGRRELTEETLEYLEGYRRSRPVRIGNAAFDQLQLDIYGELMDALYVHDAHNEATSRSSWQRIVELTDWVCRNWGRPDQGIWEVRSGCQQFLYSRVMSWVAVDRALRIGARRRFPAPRERWRAVRETLREDIVQNFWNDELGAFVGVRGSLSVDAACLVMPLVGFIQPTDPRWRSTLRVVEARLVRDALVRRYDMEGMDTDAGNLTAPAFTVLSFWYVECLARGGELEKARSTMRRLLSLANHLGLFSEDIGVDGTQLGNFPQALTHAALIGAAVELSDIRK